MNLPMSVLRRACGRGYPLRSEQLDETLRRVANLLTDCGLLERRRRDEDRRRVEWRLTPLGARVLAERAEGGTTPRPRVGTARSAADGRRRAS